MYIQESWATEGIGHLYGPPEPWLLDVLKCDGQIISVGYRANSISYNHLIFPAKYT